MERKLLLTRRMTKKTTQADGSKYYPGVASSSGVMRDSFTSYDDKLVVPLSHVAKLQDVARIAS